MPQKSNDKRHSRSNIRQKSKKMKGKRYILSTDAQAALSNLFGDVIERTFENAKKMAENEGKNQVSIDEIERALKKLSKSFRPTPTANARTLQSDLVI